MVPFPYFDIVKKAYELTLKNQWLWFFGFFIGGTTGFNFGWLNYILPPPTAGRLIKLKEVGQIFLQWITVYPQTFSLLATAVLLIIFLLMIFSGLSKGAVIWATIKLQERKPEDPLPDLGFKKSWKEGQKYLWQIIGLKLIITGAFLVLLATFLLPVGYLFLLKAMGHAIFLSLLGLLIFLPASIMFSFIHLYGPIFIVQYHFPVYEAIQHAFNLTVKKLKESIILAAFLVGLSLLFIFILLFSIILFSIPVALLTIILVKLGMLTAVYTMLFGAAIVSICYTIVLGAAFAVFQNITWILAVGQLVKARRLEQEEKALVAEPAA